MGKSIALGITVMLAAALCACSRPAKAQAPSAQPLRPVLESPLTRAAAESSLPSVSKGQPVKKEDSNPSPMPKPTAGQPTTSKQAPPIEQIGVETAKDSIQSSRKAESGLEALLTIDRDRVMLPEDFKIGPLNGRESLEGEEKAAMTSADSFIATLTRGDVAKDLLAAESKTDISDSLSYYLERGDVPSTFRMGKPKNPQEGEIAFNVRLFAKEGSAEGEIYLSLQDRRWLVSDFQINLAQLEEKREKPAEKFFPSSYRWLLGE